MTLDIRTLIFVLGITHLIQCAVLFQQYRTNKTYCGVGWWLLWSGTAFTGFIFMLLRQIPSFESIAIVMQNALITLGTVFLYIGILRFLGKRENRLAIGIALTGFVTSLLYFVYINNDIHIRTIISSSVLALISFLTAQSLFRYKLDTISAAANFTALFFFIHACIFASRVVLHFAGYCVDDVFAPRLYNYIPYLDGIIVGLLWTFGTIMMVNQRLHADANESANHFRLIFNTGPDAACITRLEDGVILDINEAFTTISGFTREESLGKSSVGINIWANQKDRESIVGELQKNGRCNNCEAVFQRKDKSLLFGLLSARIIQLEGRPHILSVTRDLTEHKQMLLKMRDEETRIRTILDLVGDPIFVKDNDHRIILANQAFYTMFCTDQHAVLGKTLAEAVPPNEQKQFLAVDRRVLDTGVSDLREEELTINGFTRTIVTRKIRFINESGKRFIVGSIHDITERKKAEVEKNNLEEQLRHSQKLQAIGQLASGISHDFNNLLGGIMGHAEILRMNVVADSPLYIHTERILASCEKAAGLTSQLLSFARKTPALIQKVDPRAVIAHIVDILQRTINHNIVISTEIQEQYPRISGDQNQLENALLNIAINARDAMPEGGRLTIQLQTINANDRALAAIIPAVIAGDYIRISIADTGIGMSKETKARIFEPFFTTKEVGKGTGLGLASVYGCVEQHHGYIIVESQVGCGTQFNIYLPAASDSETPLCQSTAIT